MDSVGLASDCERVVMVAAELTDRTASSWREVAIVNWYKWKARDHVGSNIDRPGTAPGHLALERFRRLSSEMQRDDGSYACNTSADFGSSAKRPAVRASGCSLRLLHHCTFFRHLNAAVSHLPVPPVATILNRRIHTGFACRYPSARY